MRNRVGIRKFFRCCCECGLGKYRTIRYASRAGTESSALYLLPLHYTGELISAADWYNMIPKEEIENSEFLESQITTMFEGNTGEKSVVLLEDLDDLSSVTNTYGESINLEDTVFYNDAVAELVADRCGLNILKKETLIFLDRAIIKYEGWVLDNEAYITITLRYGDADYGIDINSIRSEYNNVSFGYVDPNGVTYEYYSDEEDGKVYIFRNEEYVAELDVDISFTAEANPAWKEATNIDYMSTIFGIK